MKQAFTLRRGRNWAWLAALTIALVVSGKADADAWRDIYAELQKPALQEHVETMAALGSRVAGYPGADAAARYVSEHFRRAGLTDVSARPRRGEPSPKLAYSEPFHITVPVVRDSRLSILGTDLSYRIYPLWPNVVLT